MHEAIKKIEVKGDILVVSAHMPLRKYCKTPKEFLNTNMVIEIMKKKYNILETISETKVSNWSKPGHSRDGSWEFKIELKKKTTRKPPAKPAHKPSEDLIPETPEIEELSEPPAQSPKRKVTPSKQNTGTKRSIRGRMSKIAKNKSGE